MIEKFGHFVGGLNKDISDIVIYYAVHGCNIGEVPSGFYCCPYCYNFLILHGTVIEGANYLIPMNGSDSPLSFIAKETFVALDTILEGITKSRVPHKAPLIVILDCCRTELIDRKKESRYTTFEVKNSISRPNILVIYVIASDHVAQDGDEGQNSPFTELLLKYIDSDDSIDKVFGDIQSDLERVTNRKQVFLLKFRLFMWWLPIFFANLSS